VPSSSNKTPTQKTVGIDNLRMNEPATYDDKEFHLQRLKSKQGVYRVNSTKHIPYLGKWNISTDKENCILLSLPGLMRALLPSSNFELVPEHDTKPMEKFPPGPRHLSLLPINSQICICLFLLKEATDSLRHKRTEQSLKPAYHHQFKGYKT
jgi:hypothetical protein